MPRKIPTTPRKSPLQDRSKMTVDAILTATAQILTKEGYDKASTNQIAERAGVSIGSLYQYFPNKEALVATLVEHHANEMIEIVESKLKNFFNAPIEVMLSEIVKACLAAHAVNPILHKVLEEQVPRVGRLKQIKSAEERMTTMLRAYLQQHQIQPQNLDLTMFILGRTLESLTHSAVIEQPHLLQDEHLAIEITDLLLSYLERKILLSARKSDQT